MSGIAEVLVNLGFRVSGKVSKRLVETGARVVPGQTLATLARLERNHGFFYNKLDPWTGDRLKTWPGSDHQVRVFLSTVDNGWLAAAMRRANCE